MSISDRHMQILQTTKYLLSEELMADAVIIAVTRRKGESTETFAVSEGNLHCVRGVADYVYEKFCELEEEDEEPGESEEEAESNDDE